MFYPFIIKYLKSSNGERDMLELCSLFDDYSVIETFYSFKCMFKLHPKFYNDFRSNMVCVFDTDSNILFFANNSIFDEKSIRSFKSIQLKNFELRSRFFRFLLRLIHDCDKAFESMEICVSFLHDLSAGTLPADLWRKYCWYRTFGNVLNENSDVFHDTNF